MSQFCPQESDGAKSFTYENRAREQKLTFKEIITMVHSDLLIIITTMLMLIIIIIIIMNIAAFSTQHLPTIHTPNTGSCQLNPYFPPK